MKKLRTAALTLVVLLGVSACGDDDPVGPEPGTARVQAFSFDFTMDDAVINGPVASSQFDVPAITANVADNGAVLAYFREQGTWTAMPYTFGEESADLAAVDYTLTLGYGYDVQFLEVFYEASSGEAVDLAAQPDRVIKVVVIEGFPMSKVGIDLTDYRAVADYFGLDE